MTVATTVAGMMMTRMRGKWGNKRNRLGARRVMRTMGLDMKLGNACIHRKPKSVVAAGKGVRRTVTQAERGFPLIGIRDKKWMMESFA